MANKRANSRSGKRKSSRARFGNLLMIAMPIDKDRRPHFSFDLMPEEAGVIGLVVVHWAFLEHALFIRTARLAESAGIKIPPEAWDFSFSRRLRAFRTVADKAIKRKVTRDKTASLISRIARAEGYRHKIAHGLWSYNPKRLEQLFSMDRRERLEPFDVAKLRAFSDSIGELSFELIYPGGWRLTLFVRKDKKTGSWYGGGGGRSLQLRHRKDNAVSQPIPEPHETPRDD